MLVLITIPGCPACRRLKNWFKEHDVVYKEKNLFRILLNDSETDDLIGLESKGRIENLVIYDGYQDMSDAEKREFLQQNPGIVRKPLLYNENQDDDFLYESTENLLAAARTYCNENCIIYNCCGKHYDI